MAKPMLAYTPFMQFFADDGTLLNGGSVYIYEPGTTTLLDTYPTSADAVAGTNANANPLILDSAGRPASGGSPIDVYVTQAFKMLVKDSSGNSIRTIDNVTTLGQLISSSAKSSNYTIAASDRDKIIVVDSSGGDKTITLLAAASAGDGFVIRIKKMDTSANTVTIQANGAENIDGSNTRAMDGSYPCITLVCDGTQWIVLSYSIFNG